MAKQEQIQEKALGNMALQAFDSWAKNQEAMERGLDPTKMVEMRTKIAEEFGLVDEGSSELITSMMKSWDEWADNSQETTDEVVGYLGHVLDATEDVRTELENMTAQTYWIRVRTEMITPDPDNPFSPVAQSTAGGGSNVSITNNDTYNFNNPHGYAAVQEAQRRARRQQAGREM
jgi:hypothetical protein